MLSPSVRSAMAAAVISAAGAGAQMRMHAADGSMLGSASIDSAEMADGAAVLTGHGDAVASGEICYMCLVSGAGEEMARVDGSALGMAEPRLVKGAHLGPVRMTISV